MVRRILRCILYVVTAGFLAACSTAPLSYLDDHQVYYKTVLNRYPVSVMAVDNQAAGRRPVSVTAGDHLLRLTVAPVAGFHVPIEKSYMMSVAPCTRYYIAAQRNSRLEQDWTFVVESAWPVAACDPAQELAKAREAAAKGEQPPVTSVIANTPVLTEPRRMDGG